MVISRYGALLVLAWYQRRFKPKKLTRAEPLSVGDNIGRCRYISVDFAYTSVKNKNDI